MRKLRSSNDARRKVWSGRKVWWNGAEFAEVGKSGSKLSPRLRCYDGYFSWVLVSLMRLPTIPHWTLLGNCL